jgi:hypothetical protein
MPAVPSNPTLNAGKLPDDMWDYTPASVGQVLPAPQRLTLRLIVIAAVKPINRSYLIRYPWSLLKPSSTYFVTAGFAASGGTGIGRSVAIFHPSSVLIQSSTIMNGAGLGYPP